MTRRKKIVAYVSYKDARERDSQLDLIARYCAEIGKTAETVVEEVSPFTPWPERKIKEIAHELKAGDFLVCAEFSRLGASIVDVVELLVLLARKPVEVHFVRYGVVLDSSIYTQTFLSFLELFAAIDKEFRGLKVKEGKAIARVKKRPRKKYSRLDVKRKRIERALKRGDTVKAVAKAMEVHYQTMRAYIKANHDLAAIIKKRRPAS